VVADRDAEITRLRSTLAGRDDEIRALRAEVADREAELERLRGEVATASRSSTACAASSPTATRSSPACARRPRPRARSSPSATPRSPASSRTSSRLREQIAAREEEVATAKDRANRFSRRDEREREVNRQLRRQIADLQAQHGPLGDWQDIRTLVLRMTMSLVEADKGMLLSRDSDGDGDIDEHLELVAHEGFAADPSQSELAQRFGHEVLERDRIVREDHPGAGDSRADDEIDNLVAIPIYVRDRFSGVVVCANRREGFEQLDDEVLLALGDQAGAALQNQRLHDELRRSYISTIRMLAEAIQAKDPFLRGHSEEVSDYVGAVAERLGLDGRAREQLIVGSLLHDVGKIGISERILHKPASSRQEEFAVIQLHPRSATGSSSRCRRCGRSRRRSCTTTSATTAAATRPASSASRSRSRRASSASPTRSAR
jgi:HD-GYP domain-containing protein (c-di-GMP phosphodiesterase class II)